MTDTFDMTRSVTTMCSLNAHDTCPIQFSGFSQRPNCDCECHFEVKARHDGKPLEARLTGLAYECWASRQPLAGDKIRGLVNRLYHTVQTSPLDDEIDNVTTAIQEILNKDYWSQYEWEQTVERLSTVKTPVLF